MKFRLIFFVPIYFCWVNDRDAPRDGANIDGLVLEGARWDNLMNSLTNSRLKELFFEMPLIHIRAITKDKQELRNIYECPVYRTRYVHNQFRFIMISLKRNQTNLCSLQNTCSTRGQTYVWTFNLKTREKPSKWILAGVAIVLQP